MNQPIVQTFKRYEKKYRLTTAQRAEFIRRVQPFMRPDDYGTYTIGSLYLDTPDFRLIRASLEKPVYKEKLRLRSYGRASGGGHGVLGAEEKVQGRGVQAPDGDAAGTGRRLSAGRDAPCKNGSDFPGNRLYHAAAGAGAPGVSGLRPHSLRRAAERPAAHHVRHLYSLADGSARPVRGGRGAAAARPGRRFNGKSKFPTPCRCGWSAR